MNLPKYPRAFLGILPLKRPNPAHIPTDVTAQVQPILLETLTQVALYWVYYWK